MDTLSQIFTFLVIAVVVAFVLIVRSYNALQRLSQAVKERASNVQVTIGKKIDLVNQLIAARDNLAGGAKRIAQQADARGGANLPQGSFPLAAIRARVSAGELLADTRVARAGDTRWIALNVIIDAEPGT